jgi:hypothetical protein
MTMTQKFSQVLLKNAMQKTTTAMERRTRKERVVSAEVTDTWSITMMVTMMAMAFKGKQDVCVRVREITLLPRMETATTATQK